MMVVPLPLLAQTPNIRILGRVQAHFSTSSGDSSAGYDPAAAVSSSFEIRRLRVEADVRIGDRVSMRIVPSYEMGALRMREAFVRVALARSASSQLSLTVGQEKKPFNRYALISSNTLPSIERGLRLRGLAGVPVVQTNLLDESGYSELDIGAAADVVAANGRLTLKAGVFNGSGESSADVNNAKSFGGRVTATVIQDAERRPNLRLGLSVASRDRAIAASPTATTFTPDSSRRTTALGIDLEWGDFRPGFHLIADAATGTAIRAGSFCSDGLAPISCSVTSGRNTGNVRPGAPDSAFARFASIQAVAAWRFQPAETDESRLIAIVEPALRIDYTDPNTAASADHAVLITPVLNLHFSPTTVARFGIDFYRYRDGNGTTASARAVRIAWQSSF